MKIVSLISIAFLASCCEATSQEKHLRGEQKNEKIHVPAISTKRNLSPSCNVPNLNWIGDGYCDKQGAYNTVECAWDGGDCCQNTCSESIFTCGTHGFDCKAPSTLTDMTISAVYLGAGECTQGNGQYPLKFTKAYHDLKPHTSGTNTAATIARCQADCIRNSAWCRAAEVVTRDDWLSPECSLVTDMASFAAAGLALQNNSFGGSQNMGGVNYRTYCGNGGVCTQTNWAGGSLSLRAGYRCYLIEQSYLGEGECRQGNGQYPLKFSIKYYDLRPHTSGSNGATAITRCRATCKENSMWCKAAEVVTRDIWPTPSCYLVTDMASFAAAGLALQNNIWGGSQTIGGVNYITYCGGNGVCTQTNWAGGSLNPRAGYHCYQ